MSRPRQVSTLPPALAARALRALRRRGALSAARAHPKRDHGRMWCGCPVSDAVVNGSGWMVCGVCSTEVDDG